jgi:hypothetical protein
MMAPAFCIGVCIGVVEMERRASYEGGGECGEDEALERLWERAHCFLGVREQCALFFVDFFGGGRVCGVRETLEFPERGAG